ncbi:hypothetical protein ScPMuIL_018994 [Solemya velum]
MRPSIFFLIVLVTVPLGITGLPSRIIRGGYIHTLCFWELTICNQKAKAEPWAYNLTQCSREYSKCVKRARG